jgi:hypothetical protein
MYAVAYRHARDELLLRLPAAETDSLDSKAVALLEPSAADYVGTGGGGAPLIPQPRDRLVALVADLFETRLRGCLLTGGMRRVGTDIVEDGDVGGLDGGGGGVAAAALGARGLLLLPVPMQTVRWLVQHGSWDVVMATVRGELEAAAALIPSLSAKTDDVGRPLSVSGESFAVGLLPQFEPSAAKLRWWERIDWTSHCPPGAASDHWFTPPRVVAAAAAVVAAATEDAPALADSHAAALAAGLAATVQPANAVPIVPQVSGSVHCMFIYTIY